MDATPLTPFRIVTDGVSTQVEVAGRDVTGHLAEVVFSAADRERPRLVLFTEPQHGAIEGVAVVEQQTIAPPGDHVRQLDPELVRQLVAERGLTLTDDPYAATLEVVADLLDQTAEVPGD